MLDKRIELYSCENLNVNFVIIDEKKYYFHKQIERLFCISDICTVLNVLRKIFPDKVIYHQKPHQTFKIDKFPEDVYRYTKLFLVEESLLLELACKFSYRFRKDVVEKLKETINNQ